MQTDGLHIIEEQLWGLLNVYRCLICDLSHLCFCSCFYSLLGPKTRKWRAWVSDPDHATRESRRFPGRLRRTQPFPVLQAEPPPVRRGGKAPSTELTPSRLVIWNVDSICVSFRETLWRWNDSYMHHLGHELTLWQSAKCPGVSKTLVSTRLKFTP